MTSDDLDVLDDAACEALLRSHSFGRVGVRIADDLVILPVYYVVDGESIVYRTTPGTKLNAAVLGTRVAFEIDSDDASWSVLVRGHTHEATDAELGDRAREYLRAAWPVGVREHFVRIRIEQITGRRLRRTPV